MKPKILQSRRRAGLFLFFCLALLFVGPVLISDSLRAEQPKKTISARVSSLDLLGARARFFGKVDTDRLAMADTLN
ncbi:hypothetical protein JW992_01955, partial [candidate division KSB1 bacterium]|nr:hypothetical protein [candidate division KSB1 bacterium]